MICYDWDNEKNKLQMVDPATLTQRKGDADSRRKRRGGKQHEGKRL